MEDNIERIKQLITRVKKGTKSGIAWTEEPRNDAIEVEMIDGKKYGVVIRELKPKEESLV